MGCLCCCPIKKEEEGYRSLRSAQIMTHTKSGKPVNKTIHKQFHRWAELQPLKWTLMKKDMLWKELFRSPYTDFTQITESLYLTGMGGICEENIKGKDIKCIFNVTYELPKYTIDGIESLRIPVMDSHSEDLYPYFKDVSNKIEENTKKRIKTVVYCIGGISRAPTLVMAYLMTHKNMHLSDAYNYVYNKRTVVRPNIHFFRSLIEYEKEVYHKNFNQTIDLYHKDRTKTSIPDFALKFYYHSSVTNGDTDSDRSDSIEPDETVFMRLWATYEDPKK